MKISVSTKFFTLSVLLLLSVALFSGCKKTTEESKTVISVRGSDTMVNMVQKWAEEYMKQNANVSIQVSGGGSGTGVAALLNKTTDIANSSRDLKDKEIEEAKQKGIKYNVVAVALDGLAVIVHKENKIDNLTVAQVKDVFTGKITNFKQLGGIDKAITLYGRENSSGTYEFFKEHVLNKEDFSSTTQVLQGTAALAEAVARDVNGIAYGGVGYFAKRDDVKIIHIKKDAAAPAIAPAENGKVNFEVIWNGEYSISRNLYMIVREDAPKATEDLMNYIKSEDGQKVVEELEYIPLATKDRVVRTKK